jgi:hypothetical protein
MKQSGCFWALLTIPAFLAGLLVSPAFTTWFSEWAVNLSNAASLVSIGAGLSFLALCGCVGWAAVVSGLPSRYDIAVYYEEPAGAARPEHIYSPQEEEPPTVDGTFREIWPLQISTMTRGDNQNGR